MKSGKIRDINHEIAIWNYHDISFKAMLLADFDMTFTKIAMNECYIMVHHFSIGGLTVKHISKKDI